MNIVMCCDCGWIGKEEELFYPPGADPYDNEYCPRCVDNTHIADVNERSIAFDDSELETLWELFGDVPINNDDEIEEDFIDFPAGTYRFEIWHWFDERCSKGVKALTEVS